MMRLSYICVVIASTVAAPVSAFVVPRNRYHDRFSTFISAVSDAEHLRETQAKVWRELKKKEKDIVIEETIKGTSQDVITTKLVEEMLEAAIDFVKTGEAAEEEHAAHAHQAFEKAVKQEKVLEEFAQEAKHDAEDADRILNVYERNNLPEDFEERREMAVADIAHHVDSYVEERHRQAHNDEVAAAKEEEEALRTLQDLKLTEEEFKATLAELKKLGSATN